MSCENWREKIDVYLDAELPAPEAEQFAAHLRDCPSCSSEALARSQLKRSIHLAGAQFVPDAELRGRIDRELRPKSPRWRWAWIPQVATVAVAILIVIAGLSMWQRHRQSQQLLGELTDLHVATLASANRVDVVSSDRHTVKPWFQGKVPFTFDLPDLAGSPFELLGGRVTYLDQNPGAELLFSVRKHVLSVFLFKNSAELDRALGSGAAQRSLSFNIQSWTENSLRYVIVTDASRSDVDDLRARLEQAGR